MSRITLTDRFIKSRKATPAGQRRDYSDAVVPGLSLRVTDRGHKSFVLVARYPGATNPTRRWIADYSGAPSLDNARKKARVWLELLGRGIDPGAAEHEQKVAREAENARKEAANFAAVADEFIKRHVSKLSKRDDAETVIRRELLGEERRDGKWVAGDDPRWRNRSIDDITRLDVVGVIDRIVDRGTKAQAHNSLGYVRKLFNWAIGRGTYGLETSPCDRLKPGELIGRRMIRTRVLSDLELRLIWQACVRLGYPFGPLVQMLALTAQRRDEVADMSWPEVDLERKLWTIPASRMKADAAHIVPLGPEAIELLKTLPRWSKSEKMGEFVFTTTIGRRPVSGFGKAKGRLDRIIFDALRREAEEQGDDPSKVNIEHWVLHDLRRTARTRMSTIPADDLVRELVIAHAKPGLHKVYDQERYLEEKADLLEQWAKRLTAIVTSPANNVVPLTPPAKFG